MEIILLIITFGVKICVYAYFIIPVSTVFGIAVGIYASIKVIILYFLNLLSEIKLKNHKESSIKPINADKLGVNAKIISSVVSFFGNLNIKISNYFFEIVNKNVNLDDPSSVTYLFRSGYIQTFNAMSSTLQTALWSLHRLKNLFYKYEINGKMGRAFSCIYRFIYTLVSTIIVTIVLAFLSLLIFVILFMLMLFNFFFYLIVNFLESFYLKTKKIESQCPYCHRSFRVPSFICPGCGKIHRSLSPNAMGIFHHKCNCGYVLPSTFFNGRRNLAAACPICETELSGSSYKQVSIPVVGGPYAGKTMFISSYFKELLSIVDNNKYISYSISSVFEKNFGEILEYSCNGIYPDSTSDYNSTMYGIVIQGEAMVPSRQINLYDIAGESFDDAENMDVVQEHYRNCSGCIILFDPVANELVDDPNFDDDALYADELLDNFVNYLVNTIRVINVNSKWNKPVAIVVNKSDYPLISSQISEPALREQYEIFKVDNPEISFREFKQNRIKNFLISNGYSTFVSKVQNYFSNPCYFVSSSTGYVEEGEPFVPFGVVDSVHWIIKNNDPVLYDLLEKER